MVTSPTSPAILAETSQRVGAAAEAAEQRKHAANDPKCAELPGVCASSSSNILSLGRGSQTNLHSTHKPG